MATFMLNKCVIFISVRRGLVKHFSRKSFPVSHLFALIIQTTHDIMVILITQTLPAMCMFVRLAWDAYSPMRHYCRFSSFSHSVFLFVIYYHTFPYLFLRWGLCGFIFMFTYLWCSSVNFPTNLSFSSLSRYFIMHSLYSIIYSL